MVLVEKLSETLDFIIKALATMSKTLCQTKHSLYLLMR